MQNLPIAPQYRAVPYEPLTGEDLKQKSLEFHKLTAGESFKVIGSDLEFRLDPTTYERTDKWRRAYCVTPGFTQFGYPHKDITILTQGTHAMSPYLDLPYICYLQGDVQKDPYTVVNRFMEPGDTDYPVLDVRNPYKPKRLLREKVLEQCKHGEYELLTRYGVLRVKIFDVSNILCTGVYIPSMDIVANMFRTINCHDLELQCIFNVGNCFAHKRYFPMLRAGCYFSEPMISLAHGEFTKDGLWVNSQGKWVNKVPSLFPECKCTFVYP